MARSALLSRGRSWTDAVASASNAMMPPSPRLLALNTSTTYLSETTTISVQKIADTPPIIFATVNGMPCWGLNVSLAAYSGLVPMSPYTTPSARRARAAVGSLSFELPNGVVVCSSAIVFMTRRSLDQSRSISGNTQTFYGIFTADMPCDGSNGVRQRRFHRCFRRRSQWQRERDPRAAAGIVGGPDSSVMRF